MEDSYLRVLEEAKSVPKPKKKTLLDDEQNEEPKAKTKAEEAKETVGIKEKKETKTHKKKTLLDDEQSEEPKSKDTKAEEAKEAEEANAKKEAKTGERKKKWLLEDEEHPNRDPLTEDESERLKHLDDTVKNLAKGGKHKHKSDLLADNTAAANGDLVAEENQERLAALDTMLNSLAVPDSTVQLLAAAENSIQAQQLRLESVQNFLASENAVQDKVNHLVAFLADIPHAEPNEVHGEKHERINKWDAGKVGGPKTLLSQDTANYDPLDDDETERKAGLSGVLSNLAPHGRKPHGGHVYESEAVTPQYLAAEVKSANDLFSLASNQEQMPQMIFGGAFLLVAAVLLAVMTKRSAKKQQQQRSKEDDAFAYALYH